MNNISSAKLYDILVSPVSTEKSVLRQEQGQYTFFIKSTTSKSDVKKAVEKLFEKKVESVNIIASRTKTKKQRNGKIGRKTIMKKAIVKLQKGVNFDEIFGSKT